MIVIVNIPGRWLLRKRSFRGYLVIDTGMVKNRDNTPPLFQH